MKKVGGKVKPKILAPEQKEYCVNCCVHTFADTENDPDFLQNVITNIKGKPGKVK